MTTKKKYNLVGGGFNNYDGENKGSSIHKQESKCIEWVNHGAEDTFYVDEYIGWHLMTKIVSRSMVGYLNLHRSNHKLLKI